jgi:hypothetical protein
MCMEWQKDLTMRCMRCFQNVAIFFSLVTYQRHNGCCEFVNDHVSFFFAVHNFHFSAILGLEVILYLFLSGWMTRLCGDSRVFQLQMQSLEGGC